MTRFDRILFIDDEPQVRAAFARTIRRQGMEVDVAGSREEALELVGKAPYAVVATDYRMPGMNGLTLLGELHRLQPLATTMLISGECDLTLAIDAVNEHGVSYLVTKPWDGAELGSLLQRAIASYHERSLQGDVQRAAVESNRAYDDQKRKLQQALQRSETFLADILINALDLRHHETRAHCRRVAAYARVLGESMGLSETLLLTVFQGALLHDVGKMGVPDGILLKPGPLDEQEWMIMQQHSAMGANLLEGFDSLAGAREIVLHHHERWNGTGYPAGLSGEAICIGARVFAVVDALDAMLSRRPYREPMKLEAAVKQITVNAGTQFDPTVVEAFLKIPQQRWIDIRSAYVDEDPALVAEQAA